MKDELYKALIEDSLMGYASYKVIRNRNDEPCDFAFIEANTACKEIFGWKGRKIIGKRISALYPSNKNQGNRYPEFYNNVDVQGVGKEYEYYAVPLQKWYRVHTIMLDPDHFAALFIDVSEQKKTQAEIIEEKDYFQRMFNTNPDASLVSRLSDGIILDVNDGFVTNMGYSREEVLGKGTLEMHLYENPALRGRILNEIALKGYCSNVETSFRRKDGKIITGILSAKMSTLHGDECIISNTREITDLKQAEEQIRQSEERFQLLFEQAPLAYQALNAMGCFIEVNQTWLDTFGYVREDVIGKWLGDFLTPEYVEGFREQFLLFKVRGHMQSEFNMIHKTGKELIISFEGRIAYDIHGKFKQSHCILRDVTDLRSTEKALAHSHELMRYVIEHDRSGIAIFDREMNYLYVSQRYLDDFKVHEKDIIGKNHYRVFPNLTRGLREVHQRALAGEIIRAEDDPYKRKDGTTDWTRWECRPWYEADESIGGIIIYSEIITERKLAEEKLLYQSNHDYLTGLYNRRFFEEELKRLDTKRNFPMTLVMGDVNGLKLINDSFGHALGDELLIKTAEVMKSVCRADDIIARLGGDEFAIILPKTDAVMAENIVERLNDRATIEKIGSIDLSICFGHESKIVEEDDIQMVLTKAENHLYRNKLYKSSSMRSKTVDIVMKTLFEKSGREMAHSNRVSEICGDIAHHVPLDSESVSQIRTAGLMHDIGKIGIDENILNKPNRLSDEEWTEMKRHPEVGWRILSSVDEFSELAQFILEHHERWDGKGYPKGLTGTDISIEGRIIAIADSFDAMTSFRTYRKSLSDEEAIMEIKRCAGTQFDPEVAKIFVEKVMRKTW